MSLQSNKLSSYYFAELDPFVFCSTIINDT